MSSEPDFRRLFERAPASYLVLSPDFTIVAVSDAYLEATMTKRPKIVGRPLFEVFPDNPEDPKADGVRNLRASLDRVLLHHEPDRMPIQKYDVRRPTGGFEVRYWRPTNSPILGADGQVDFIIHHVEDVTSELRAETNLVDTQVANERLRLFIDHAPVSIAMFDREMRYLFVSKRWRSDYGLGDRDIIGQSHYTVFPELSDDWKEAHRRALAGEVLRSASGGEKFVRKDGTERWLRWEVRPWRDLRGTIQGVVIFSEDLTEETRAAREVRRVAQWLRVALASAKAGVWQWNLATNENTWSDEIWELYGLDRQAVTPSFDAWVSALLPEDRAQTIEKVRAAAAARSELAFEFRVRQSDGTIRHLLSRAQPIREEGGGEAYLGISIDFTDQRRLEELLRERDREAAEHEKRRSEERYRDLLDAAPDAMFLVDRTGRIQTLNAQAERMFGYESGELLGELLERLIPERSRGTHAEQMKRYFETPLSRPMGAGLDLTGRRKDGSLVPIEVSLGPVRTPTGLAVSAAVRDITERRNLAAAATRMAQRLTSAVESMDDAFVLFDDQNRLVLCNNPFRRLLGFSDDTPLIGRSHDELFQLFLGVLDYPSDDARRRFGAELWAAARDAHPVPFDVRTLDGRSLRVLMRWTLEGGVLVTFWDLTAEERRNEEMRRAHALATAANAAKTEFLSSMSHELRTPLNAVLGFAQLLERDQRQPLTDRQHERVRRILTGGEQLLRLVDDVLDLARIEAGRVSISVEPVAVDEVLSEVKRTLEPMQAQHGIEIEIEPQADLPRVAVDRMRYVQIISNFCSNALKYNRPHGTIRVTAERRPDERVRVTVTDSGYGIPVAKLALLFQPFQRAGQETGPIEGTGIGLVITRKLAALMNGEVGFESVEGKGASFWVDVPMHRVKSGTADHIMPIRSAVVARHEGPRRRVLYIEDNPANLAFMRDMMALLERVTLSTATSAEEGLEIAFREVPDLVILDINLAGAMTGLDATKALRASRMTRLVPIVGLSAGASPADRERAVAAGFDHYLTKPVVVDELVSLLEKILWPSSSQKAQ